MPYVPVRRVNSVRDLPWEALSCAAVGRHLGFLDNITVARESNGLWGELDARKCIYICTCTRVKEEVIDWDTGAALTRHPQYYGGVLTYSPVAQRDAKLELLHRTVEKATGAEVLAERRAVNSDDRLPKRRRGTRAKQPE